MLHRRPDRHGHTRIQRMKLQNSPYLSSRCAPSPCRAAAAAGHSLRAALLSGTARLYETPSAKGQDIRVR